MSETCPVCKTECSDSATTCSICGFKDELGINRTWAIKEDLSNWLETIVKPYRVQWEARKREAELIAQLKASKNNGEKQVTIWNIIKGIGRSIWSITTTVWSGLIGLFFGFFAGNGGFSIGGYLIEKEGIFMGIGIGFSAILCSMIVFYIDEESDFCCDTDNIGWTIGLIVGVIGSVILVGMAVGIVGSVVSVICLFGGWLVVKRIR
jgi:hypothetical protein